jgi:hypothetical protein
VIRRLIDAAHDRLGDCLNALTADPEADARIEDELADAIAEDAKHVRLADGSGDPE